MRSNDYPEGFYCPCREVDPEHFISNKELKWLIENKDKYKFTQQDYFRIYNCIHCNECGTSEERFLLKEKFLKDGGKIEGLNETISNIERFGTPFFKNKSRIEIPAEVEEQKDTILYFGCFTAVKTPNYGKSIMDYLLAKGIEFSVLEKEVCCGYPILCNGAIDSYKKLVECNKDIFRSEKIKEIITVCPSCYIVFKKELSELNIKVRYFTEYLTRSEQKKDGNLAIQHACPLRNGEIPGITEKIEKIYEESGYNVLREIPNRCCGGGIGHQLRTEIIDAIANKRMEDFINIIKQNKISPNKKNYITTYCPDAFWILKVFGKRKKIPFKLKELCELLR
ncbi:MAG: heterodisulfide reductase-related iron-sulfur binding cluster [Promethearchaeia archaeon]